MQPNSVLASIREQVGANHQTCRQFAAVQIRDVPVHTPAEFEAQLARVLATEQGKRGRDDYRRGVCEGHGRKR